VIDSIAREKKGVKAREEREVPERRKVVVREVNCILMLGNTQVLNCGDLVPYTRRAKLISIQLL
jgi:hypothetical protein